MLKQHASDVLGIDLSLPGGPYDQGLFNHLQFHFPNIELVVHKKDSVTEIAQAIRHVARGQEHYGSRVKAVLERCNCQTV